MSLTVCIVNPYEHGGGAEYQISLLIDELAGAERCDIVYLAHFVDGRERTRRYRVQRVGAGRGVPRLGYLMDARSLIRKLDESRPQVIYQRVAGAYTGICAFYARRHGVPLIWHVAHDTDVMPTSLDPGRNVLKVRLEKAALNYGARRAGHIVVQTRHQAALLHENFGRQAEAVIPNFHPPAVESLDKSGPFTVLWIANLKPWKRPGVFVRLAAALTECRDVRFVMVGAGGGNPAWRDGLLRDIAAVPNLTYLGGQTQDEVNALLARAHLFVNTSTQEGFPNTFIQSWLRDVVVVSLDVDPDDVLATQRVGIITKSAAGLTDAVRRLISDSALREDYAARGREHARRHHSLDNVRSLARLIERCARDAG